MSRLEKKIGPLKLTSLGLQHVFAMYAGAILVPLIVGGALHLNAQQSAYLIGIDLLTCGIATLLQAWNNRFFGIGLPVILGSSFVALTPMISIGSQYGISAIYGSIIAGGLFIVLFSKYLGKMLRLFPPVVTGTVVTIIGMSLVPSAIRNMAGGVGSKDFGSISNLLLAFGVIAFILVLNHFFTGFVRALSVLMGLIIGTIVSSFMGKVSLANVAEASWLHIPKPFYFGAPTFEVGPILTMILVCIVIIIESTGVFLALGKICDRQLTEEDFKKGYRAEGLAIILGGLFNAFPYNTFAQNVGLVQLSKVKSTNVIVASGFILVLLGFVPKIAAFATIIPAPVLGGAMVVLFGMVISSGIKMLSVVNFEKQSNLLIIACSLALGLGVTVVPDLFAKLPAALKIIVSDGVITGSLTAIILNICLNILGKKSEDVHVDAKDSTEYTEPMYAQK
ncbi:purine permease [Terrilactibacillus sp. BCM23-1]|uniref:Purine permease n=1 Tax=Terrilactibacillus tamarindi TaxID=2599694 RepID=A0A6N8CP58_9BACI|nr:nucleobase:cation symporter-2 family protein [Terrilactibacillus tamarindi]MTT31370.1 purine permease [Terrilactibacillus tamarindi]